MSLVVEWAHLFLVALEIAQLGGRRAVRIGRHTRWMGGDHSRVPGGRGGPGHRALWMGGPGVTRRQARWMGGDHCGGPGASSLLEVDTGHCVHGMR